MKFPEQHRAILEEVVADARGNYGDQDYPFNETERREAAHVKSALLGLGYEVSLADAAAVWEAYSQQLQAGWLDGADTVQVALGGIMLLCSEIYDERIARH